MAKTDLVVFRKGPADGLPTKIVPGTLLVDTTNRNVYLDATVDGQAKRLWLNEIQKTQLAPGESFEIVNEGDIYNVVKITGSSITMESPPGNIIFQITKNGVIMSPEIIKSFQEVLGIPKALQDLGPIYVRVNALPAGATPYGRVEGSTFIFGLPQSSSSSSSGVNDGHLHDTGEVDPPGPTDPDYDDGSITPDSKTCDDLDDGSFDNTPTKDYDDGSLV